MKYIVLDTETGGLDPMFCSLLTAYFAVTDEQLNVLDTLDLKLKETDDPNTNYYYVTEKALEVNKIDLRTHSKDAVTYKAAGTLLYNFIKKNSNDGAEKLIPIGCNVAFDIKHICKEIISQGSWEKHCSYRVEDIGSHIRLLQRNGLLSKSMPGSLSKTAEYFGIDSSLAHSASGDVELTIKVLKELEKVFKQNTSGNI